MVERITGPDSPAPSFVQWKQLDSRQAALDEISKGEAYAAIVIPKNYSKTLASMSGPPPGATSGPPPAAVISDPVRGKVSEADVSTEVGLLPKAPKPAEIEVLSNPSAGPSASAPVQNISTGIVQGVSQATSERLSKAAGEQGARLTPEVAAVISDPVRANVTEAEPVGDNSGNGQSPFFLAFLANLAGFGGAAGFLQGCPCGG